jgi:hypothetical protein
MITPEIDTGEGQLGDNFIRVNAIVIPGEYRFATNPNTSPRKNHNWADSELVAGERPLWELEIFEGLKRMRNFSYTPLNTESKRITKEGLDWQAEEGYLTLRGQSCHALLSRGIDGKKTIGHLTLIDEVVDGQEVSKSAKDGCFSLQLIGDDSEFYFNNDPRWRGWISVSGNASEIIKKAIRMLHKSATIGNVPFWEQK